MTLRGLDSYRRLCGKGNAATLSSIGATCAHFLLARQLVGLGGAMDATNECTIVCLDARRFVIGDLCVGSSVLLSLAAVTCYEVL